MRPHPLRGEKGGKLHPSVPMPKVTPDEVREAVVKKLLKRSAVSPGARGPKP